MATADSQLPITPNFLQRTPGPKCTVCSHSKRDTIDSLIIDNKIPLSDIARQFELDDSAIHRHKGNHVPARLVKVGEQMAVEADKQFAKLAITQSLSRLARLQTRADQLEAIRVARASASDPGAPGSETGLLVLRKKVLKTGKETYETVTESEIDTALLAEERAIDRAAAIETGEYLAQMGRAQFGQGEGKGPMVIVMTGGLHPIETPGPQAARHTIQDPRRTKTPAATAAEALPVSMVDVDQVAEYLPDTRERSLSGEDLELEGELLEQGDDDGPATSR